MKGYPQQNIPQRYDSSNYQPNRNNYAPSTNNAPNTQNGVNTPYNSNNTRKQEGNRNPGISPGVFPSQTQQNKYNYDPKQYDLYNRGAAPNTNTYGNMIKSPSNHGNLGYAFSNQPTNNINNKTPAPTQPAPTKPPDTSSQTYSNIDPNYKPNNNNNAFNNLPINKSIPSNYSNQESVQQNPSPYQNSNTTSNNNNNINQNINSTQNSNAYIKYDPIQMNRGNYNPSSNNPNNNSNNNPGKQSRDNFENPLNKLSSFQSPNTQYQSSLQSNPPSSSAAPNLNLNANPAPQNQYFPNRFLSPQNTINNSNLPAPNSAAPVSSFGPVNPPTNNNNYEGIYNRQPAPKEQNPSTFKPNSSDGFKVGGFGYNRQTIQNPQQTQQQQQPQQPQSSTNSMNQQGTSSNNAGPSSTYSASKVFDYREKYQRERAAEREKQAQKEKALQMQQQKDRENSKQAFFQQFQRKQSNPSITSAFLKPQTQNLPPNAAPSVPGAPSSTQLPQSLAQKYGYLKYNQPAPVVRKENEGNNLIKCESCEKSFQQNEYSRHAMYCESRFKKPLGSQQPSQQQQSLQDGEQPNSTSQITENSLLLDYNAKLDKIISSFRGLIDEMNRQAKEKGNMAAETVIKYFSRMQELSVKIRETEPNKDIKYLHDYISELQTLMETQPGSVGIKLYLERIIILAQNKYNQITKLQQNTSNFVPEPMKPQPQPTNNNDNYQRGSSNPKYPFQSNFSNNPTNTQGNPLPNQYSNNYGNNTNENGDAQKFSNNNFNKAAPSQPTTSNNNINNNNNPQPEPWDDSLGRGRGNNLNDIRDQYFNNYVSKPQTNIPAQPQRSDSAEAMRRQLQEKQKEIDEMRKKKLEYQKQAEENRGLLNKIIKIQPRDRSGQRDGISSDQGYLKDPAGSNTFTNNSNVHNPNNISSGAGAGNNNNSYNNHHNNMQVLSRLSSNVDHRSYEGIDKYSQISGSYMDENQDVNHDVPNQSSFEDTQRLFYSKCLSFKMKLPSSHLGQHIPVSILYKQALNSGLRQDQWDAFIQKAMETPQDYIDFKKLSQGKGIIQNNLIGISRDQQLLQNKLNNI